MIDETVVEGSRLALGHAEGFGDWYMIFNPKGGPLAVGEGSWLDVRKFCVKFMELDKMKGRA